jgi:hypothetical protein
MKVLGRELVSPFDAFWEQFKAEIPVRVEHIEEAHSSVFGDQGADATAPDVPAWVSLPDDDLAYHVAHELAHMVLRRRGFPRTGRGLEYPEGSAEARIGGDLEEMVSHAALEWLLLPFGFKREFIQRRTFSGAFNGLSRSPVPSQGTPWFSTWAIRYCELKLDMPHDYWLRLEAIYESRSPQVAQLGRELEVIMREVGWGTREQALEALLRARDALGLDDGVVLIVDPVSGNVF